jgi:ABC-type nitrate/sulfonate/bicarbonate transport system substrate-binding protein
MIKTVKVGGVPEHFNLAWHLAIENGKFAEKGIEIEWIDVPGGTGAMCKMLRDGEIDIAIALTEGVIADITQGNQSKIVQFYVNSPLRWGIFVNSKSPINTIAEMQGHKYAISRYKSGSHLMAFVNAANNNLIINDKTDFEIVENLTGARKAIAENTAQLFMWEKFTTKPFVDNGEFKMIGECKTPWPCFALVATNEFIKNQPQTLDEVLEIVNQSCNDLKFNEDAVDLIAWRYQIKLADAMKWFGELEYAAKAELNEEEMNIIFGKLLQFKIINSIPNIFDICYSKTVELA